MAQFAFNNSVAVTGILPFFVNYEKHLGISKASKGLKSLSEKANILVERIKELQKMLKEDLEFIV